MVCGTCQYETSRLIVHEWHSPLLDALLASSLPEVVASLLTPQVTRFLPEPWQGPYSVKRAREWIQERDREGVTLIAIERTTGLPVGLVILFEAGQAPESAVDLRLGYVLADSAWGRGLASELISGLVGWCRGVDVASIIGGVEPGNVASSRVLEKNGFLRVADRADRAETAEQFYELRLRPMM